VILLSWPIDSGAKIEYLIQRTGRGTKELRRNMWKKFFKYFVGAALVALLAVGVIATIDGLVIQIENASNCRSDRMYAWQKILADYQIAHQGQLPPSLPIALEGSAWAKSVAEAQDHPFLTCDKTKKPYRYLPQDIQMPQGKVILMCPGGSHGLIDKFAFGIAFNDGDWNLVKINSDNIAEVRTTIGKIR
jgi:hypothetical protein